MAGNNANKVRYGLKSVHYAVLTVGENGTPTFSAPVPIPGAVNLSMSPEGDTTPFYADGTKYYISVANNGYSGDLEIALLPDSFRKDVLGETEDATDKVMVENANVEPVPFALLFQFDGDKKGIRHVFFNCTAARPNVEGATTTDSKEPATETLSIEAAPLENGMVKAKTAADTPEEVYENWYKAVWMPGQAQVGG